MHKVSQTSARSSETFGDTHIYEVSQRVLLRAVRKPGDDHWPNPEFYEPPTITTEEFAAMLHRAVPDNGGGKYEHYFCDQTGQNVFRGSIRYRGKSYYYCISYVDAIYLADAERQIQMLKLNLQLSSGDT